ncbi:hypothetical protein PCANC_11549 [Puccinia coronata f. sp. avenae]|uniref:Autophagy-related protein 9 n=1 Tax=Puccinia coronata f. sp. avenae TaxID=200324 RepID=A0A2N5UQF6_9BASI|nr:hypothetical protein PCANC_11549 [Puccinia coronata f. sp. avenae]
MEHNEQEEYEDAADRNPFSYFTQSQRNHTQLRTSSTLTQLNLEHSQSILSILQPAISNNSNSPGIDSFHRSADSKHKSTQDGEPAQSIMIDIPQPHPNKQRRAFEDEDYHTENSSSPSPSLTRHPEQQQQHQKQPPPPPQQQQQQQHPPPQTKLTQSILHQHRPISSSPLTANHHPYPRSALNESPSLLNGTPCRSGLLAKLKQIWNQERDLYFSRQNTPQPLNTYSHHNQTTDDPEQQQRPQDANHLTHTHLPLGAKDMALWRWVNVDDLDSFLQDVYSYYVGNGIWAIGLSRLCNLMTVGFVIGFSIFLFGCIDYSILRSSHHLHEVVVPQCVSRFSGLTLLLVLNFSGYYSWRVFKFGHEISNLWKMHEFFTELLEVSEADIQTIPWYQLVEQLSHLKDQHPATIATGENEARRRPIGAAPNMQSVLQRKLDAHDVANQIMREQNYLIALFNKDILNLRPPLPNWMVGNMLVAENHLTTSLEWNLLFALRGFLLDQRGQVKPEFLVSSRHNSSMALGLQRRFRLMAIVNLIFGPFIVVYVLIYSFFRYFEEYHKNPSSIGSRSFTRLAQWKFREYNELPHLFQERLVSSYCLSKQYIDYFPKTKTTILAKFVSFIAGSFAGVLIVLSLFDPDAFLHFEITSERSVLFYIGLFGSILAISRGMIKQEYDEKIKRPEELMERIVGLTHYLPPHWYGKLHGLEVYNDFGQLFQLKIVNFLNELMSILLTPFILWYNFDLGRCQRIIDFFREFTVHVDGIGYVCSFSVFDFNKLDLDVSPGLSTNPPLARHPPEARTGRPAAQPTPNVQQNDISKMERSLLSFVAHHPNWEPSNQTASLYLSKAIGFSTAGESMLHPHYHHPHPPYHAQQPKLGNTLISSGASHHLPQPQQRHGYLAPTGRSHLAGQLSLFAGGGDSFSGPASHSFLPAPRGSPIGLRSRASRPASLGAGGSPVVRTIQPGVSSSSHSSFSPLTGRRAPGKAAMMGVEAIDEEDPPLSPPSLPNNTPSRLNPIVPISPHSPSSAAPVQKNHLPPSQPSLLSTGAVVDEDDPFQQP